MHYMNYQVGCFDCNVEESECKVYYQDTDSNYCNVAMKKKMLAMGYGGDKMGQFKDDTGGVGSRILEGLWAQRLLTGSCQRKMTA